MPFAQAGTRLKGPVGDRSTESSNVNFSKKCEDELVDKRQQTGDKKNRVQFTESTIERDDLKEQQKEAEIQRNLKAAHPTFKSRLEEFSATIWQSTPDDLVANPTSSALQGPVVDRSVKPGPTVNRELKPSD